MATEKEDTDPSSPGALRSPAPRSGRTVAAYAVAEGSDLGSGRHPTTDPGLGPSDAPPPISARKAVGGLRVPPPSNRPPPMHGAVTPPELTPIAPPMSRAKDSVELLLEGMAGPRPDRRKTTPQSDGEASAMYHAEHGVRPARTTSDPAPKVLVERSSPGSAPVSRQQPITDRSLKSPASRRESREALSTFVPARVLRRRMAVALVAGLLLVMLLFVGFQLTVGKPASTPPTPPASPAVGTAAHANPAQPPTFPPSIDPAVTASATPVPIPPARNVIDPATAAGTSDVPPATPGAVGASPGTDNDPSKGHAGRAHHAGAAGAASSDLGEFKTTF